MPASKRVSSNRSSRSHCAGLRSSPNDTTIAAIRALNKAQNIDQAERALAQFQIVTQSALIADVDGRIGMVVTGRIPMRDRANDLHGLVPAPGWEARYDWRGYLPAEQAPRMRDPASGVIVTANHKVVSSEVSRTI